MDVITKLKSRKSRVPNHTWVVIKKRLSELSNTLYLLPSLLGFSLFFVIPFVQGFVYSFYQSGFDKTFVGLKNYLDVLSSEAFRLAIFNNLVFMVFGIGSVMVISFSLGLMIHELKAKTWIKLALILPIAIPSAVTSGFFKNLFASGADNILTSDFAMVAVILIYIWRSVGYNLIIYLAAFGTMDKRVQEAADIDGCTYLQKVWHVILPLSIPSTVFVFIVSLMNSYKVFKDVFILQGNYPNPKIYMLQHYMNNMFRNLRYQHLTAAAYIFAALIFTAAGIMFWIDRQHAKKFES